MANQGEAVEVVIGSMKTDVILNEQCETIIGARNEIGWSCHNAAGDYFLAWNGKLYNYYVFRNEVGDFVGESPTWRALLKETAQALSPETNYGAW